MPAMTDDLYPVFVLSCTSARQIVSPNVYIVPVGTHDCWAKPYFVFSFIKNLPQPFFRFAVFERFFGISERPFYSGGRAYLIMSRSREVTSIHIT